MSYRRRRSRTRGVSFIGAVGAIGFAVYYFLDPELGPRRRREVVGAVHEAAAGALRFSQELVARLVEPPVSAPGPVAPPSVPAPPPEVTVERRLAEHEPTPDLAATLHDEVSFFTVGEDSRLHEAGPVAVAASRPEPLRVAQAAVHEGPAYPAPPEPRIIAYDAADSSGDHEAPGPAEVHRGAEYQPTKHGLIAVLAVAVLLAAAAALGAWAIWGGDDTSSASPGANQAIELISQPGARRVAVNGSKGTMVLVTTPNGRAVLIVTGLQAAPKGKQYQAWIVTGKTPHPAGLFKGGGTTTLVIPLSQRIPKGSIFAVTVEKAGGVPAPTMAPEYTAKLT